MTGLPPFLADSPGRDSGMMMLEYAAQSAAANPYPGDAERHADYVGIARGQVPREPVVDRSAAHRRCVEALRLLVATELVVAIRRSGTPANAGRRPVHSGCSSPPTRCFPRLETRRSADVKLTCTALDRWTGSVTQYGVDRRLADTP